MQTDIVLVDNTIWLDDVPVAVIYRDMIKFEFRGTTYHQFVDTMKNLPLLYKGKITIITLGSRLSREAASIFINDCTNYLYDHDWVPYLLNNSQKLAFAEAFRKVIARCRSSKDINISPYDLDILSVTRFTSVNPDELLIRMEERPDHWFDALVVFKGEKNYPSGRPKTTMSKFLKSGGRSFDLTKSEKIESYTGIPIQIGKKYALPVTRYSLGMTRGL